LFPPEYVQEFQNCFDRAPVVPFEDIQRILHEELGRPIDSVYEYVDSTPIASASIAQVHIFSSHSPLFSPLIIYFGLIQIRIYYVGSWCKA
jgi:predicted unusual protein kinase regulating ubiquinone biosynthesis (AarF/ABC1/UbiB family)